MGTPHCLRWKEGERRARRRSSGFGWRGASRHGDVSGCLTNDVRGPSSAAVIGPFSATRGPSRGPWLARKARVSITFTDVAIHNV